MPTGGRTVSATCCITFLKRISSSPSRGLRRKTLELATKQLFKIRDLSPFDRNYTLQSALGTHVVPADRLMTNAAIWIGLAAPGETPEQAAETLKSAVRKADVPVFAHYLRCLSVDPRLVKAFEPGKQAAAHAADPQTMIERLETLFKEADSAAKKAGKKQAAGPRVGACGRRSRASQVGPCPRQPRRRLCQKAKVKSRRADLGPVRIVRREIATGIGTVQTHLGGQNGAE